MHGLLMLALCSASGPLLAAKGWMHAQIVAPTRIVSERFTGFHELRLAGHVDNFLSPPLHDADGVEAGTLTIKARLKPGSYRLEALRSSDSNEGLLGVTIVNRFEVALEDTPSVTVRAGQITDLGVLLVLLPTSADAGARLVRVAERSQIAPDSDETVNIWDGPPGDVAANLRDARDALPILAWYPGNRQDEDFVLATLGRMYWRRAGQNWTPIDLPTLQQVQAVSWHPGTGRYWVATENDPLRSTEDLLHPSWQTVDRNDSARVVRHLGLLPDQRLWMYEYSRLPKGRSSWVSALTDSGRWQRVAIPRSEFPLPVLDAPGISQILNFVPLHYDTAKSQFAEPAKRHPYSYLRLGNDQWVRLGRRSSKFVLELGSNAADWTAWGPGPKVRGELTGLALEQMQGWAIQRRLGVFPARVIVELLHSSDQGRSWSVVRELPFACSRLRSNLAEFGELVIDCPTGFLSSGDGGRTLTPWQPKVAVDTTTPTAAGVAVPQSGVDSAAKLAAH